MQMFFSFNMRALEQPNRHRVPGCVELTEEEGSRGTGLLSSAGYFADDEIMAVSGSESDDEPAEEAEGVELDEEEEEEGEQEEEDRSDKEEKEEKEERPKEQILRDFIIEYVAQHHITDGYRWPEHKRLQLQTALLAAGVKDTENDVVMRIKQYVKPSPVVLRQ
jgi:hypothetical protein